jgi:hypothetical protein
MDDGRELGFGLVAVGELCVLLCVLDSDRLFALFFSILLEFFIFHGLLV